MKNQADTDRQIAPLTIESVVEDLFGLNLRGLRSIAKLWTRPRDYFMAAKVANWNDRFTPSIRLWLFFFALFSAFKFLWVGSGEGMIEAFANGFSEARIQVPEGQSYRDIGKEAVLLIFGLLPFLQIIGTIIIAFIYPFWGERTTIALRQRYFFGVIVPSASLMPVFMTVMMFLPGSYLTAYGLMLALITFVVDFQTGYRGAFINVSGMKRAWRAGLLSLTVVSFNVVVTIIAQFVGIIYIGQKYGVMPMG
jgi:hypothetical protein